MKIISYNVNGLRAAMKKSFVEWLAAANPDILCLQEIKANPEQVDFQQFEALGYKLFWYPAQKKGYSGVAIFSKTDPDHVEYGMGIEAYDFEGRLIRVDFGDISVLCTYFPSGSNPLRQSFKMKFLGDFEKYIGQLRKERKKLIICGDYNICHKAIDLHNPERNKNTPGFLPEEREWMDSFVDSGFVDSFRFFNPTPHNYTWWSYRSGARKRNLGWRIDYFMVTKNLAEKMKRAQILSEAIHSDHCPLTLELTN